MGQIVRIGEDVLGVLILVALVTGGAYWGFQSYGFWFGVSVLVMLPLGFLQFPLQQALGRRGLGWLRWPLFLLWVLWFVWIESMWRGWSWAAVWGGLRDPALIWAAIPSWDPRFLDDPSVRAYLGLTVSTLALFAVGAGSLWRTLTIIAAIGLQLYSFVQVADVVRANEAEQCARERRLAGMAVPRVVGAVSLACPSVAGAARMSSAVEQWNDWVPFPDRP